MKCNASPNKYNCHHYRGFIDLVLCLMANLNQKDTFLPNKMNSKCRVTSALAG